MISQHSRPNVRRALVLGAGGAAAMAWEVGVIGGLAEAGVEVREADVVVGTSAGSMVGAQITKGGSLQELLATYLNRQAPSPAAGPPPTSPGCGRRYSVRRQPAEVRRTCCAG